MLRRVVLFCLMVLSLNIWAESVKTGKVEDIANEFIANYFPSEPDFTIKRVEPVRYNDIIVYYNVGLAPEGWLLVSADNTLQPVIGFSYTSEYNESVNDSLPSSKAWFKSYKEQIVAQIDNREAKIHEGWNSSNSFKTTATVVSDKVDPLIPVEWNQNSGYNRYCPADEDGPGGHAYAGCVAVAMAQAMSVHQYPEHAYGKNGYSHDTYGTIFVNYDYEPDYVWDDMKSSSSDEHNSLLIYHAAVSVDMDFGPNGSGAMTVLCASSLSTYFGYPSGIKYQERYENDDEWIALLKSELDAGRPMIYDGDADDGNSGHAFNIDGYVGNYFHLNWGWSGSNNGNFLINSLTPSGYDFSKNQGAVVGIREPIPSPTGIKLSSKKVKENLPVGSFVGMVEVEDELIDNVYTYELFGENAGIMGYADPYFYISNDSLKTAVEISFAETPTLPLRIEVTDQFDNFYAEEFTITIVENDTTPVNSIASVDVQSYSLDVYPNPTNDVLYVRFNEDLAIKTASIYTINGAEIKRYSHSKIDLNNGFDVSEIENGIYMLSIIAENKTYVAKFIKE